MLCFQFHFLAVLPSLRIPVQCWVEGVKANIFVLFPVFGKSIVCHHSVQFSSVQLLCHVQLFVTLWTAACRASLYITKSQSLPKLMSIDSVMPSSHLIFCHPFLLLPSIFPRIRVFSNKSVLRIRLSFKFSINPSNEYSVLISFRMDWLDLLAV